MSELKIDDHTFLIGRLNPRAAFHVGRRVIPFVGSLMPLIPLLVKQDEEGGGLNPADPSTLAKVIQPISETLAAMKDEDADYVINHCMGVVQVKIGEERGWASVMAGGQIMFEWINVAVMMQLVWAVIQENLGSFFPARLPTS